MTLKQFPLFFLLLLFFQVQAENKCLADLKEAPTKRLVQDYAEILQPAEETRLEQELVAFNNSTSTQLLVITVTDLCDYDPASFTYTLGENWGVGQKGFDNGIVMMIKPTGGKGQRKTFIAVGYGLEAVIPDATAKRIIENEMLPQFRNGQFYTGIKNATDVLRSLALKEFSAKEYNKKAGQRAPVLPLLFVLFVVIFLLISRANRARRHVVGGDLPFWTALMLMNNSRHRHHGGWSNFSSGSGNFGGFGGFGGGSFGGGGAGGSW
jgi:uncharacterized protein